MLELQGVHTYYGDSHVLRGVTMAIKEGMLAALLGRNGMGKTTTVHTIMGFNPPERGRIVFEGKDLAGLPPYEIARALMTNPKLILMDEPFEGLAPEIVRDVCSKIDRLKSSGVSILLVEQNMQAALKLEDYVYIIDKGSIVYEGTPRKTREEEEVVKRYMVV